MVDKVNRLLSIQFSTRFFKGLRHEDGLCAIESEVIRDNIKSVQITESDCVVTLKDQIYNERLLANGIEIKNRYVKFVDVDKQLTNITIKDLPYELADQFLATHPAKFGQVVDGSIKRGYIRETTIENGTRYAQLLNCIQLIPNRTSFEMCASSLTTIARRVHTVVEPTTHHSDVKTNQINNEFATIVMSVGIL